MSRLRAYLLDLTAAFDTVNHDLLMLRLGLRGVVLQWFSSYLSDRTFQVVFGGSTSSVVIIVCSVPQGSVLGLRLFILYTSDLADVAAAHDVNIHSYADDRPTQLYLQCQRRDITTTIQRREICTTDVRHWMTANRLKVNADKTELCFSCWQRTAPLRLGDETITASDHVRLLGVTISSDLSTDKHVSHACSACRFEGFAVRLTLSLQKHWYTPSSHAVLMTAMPRWPGRQKPALIVFSVC